MGIYIFAVAASQRFGSRIDHPELPVEFGPVRVVAVSDLVALVSTFTGPPIQGATQTDLVRRLLLHQTVIESLMRVDSILPVRLGTVVDDDETLRRLLRTSDRLIRTTWERYRDRVEVDVAATCDLPQTFAGIAKDPEVQAAKAAADATAPQQGTTAAIEVGRLVEAKLAAFRAEVEGEVVEALRPYAHDLRLNAMTAEPLVCNVGFLIDDANMAAFDETLQLVDTKFEGRCEFRRVGPLPPYSFATVHVHRLDPNTVAAARELFGLSGRLDEGEVLERYRQLVLERHPDARRSDPSAARAFEEVATARSVLLAVCRSGLPSDSASAEPVLYASVERSPGRD